MILLSSASNKFTKYIYVVQEREHVGTCIIKIGRVYKQSWSKRMSGYPKGSVILLLCMVDADATKVAEDALIWALNANFVRRRDIGTEYFEGPSLRAMLTLCQTTVSAFLPFQTVTKDHIVVPKAKKVQGGMMDGGAKQKDEEEEEEEEEEELAEAGAVAALGGAEHESPSHDAAEEGEASVEDGGGGKEEQGSESDARPPPCALARDIEFLLYTYVDGRRAELSSATLKVIDFATQFARWCHDSAGAARLRMSVIKTVLFKSFHVACETHDIPGEGPHPCFVFPNLTTHASCHPGSNDNDVASPEAAFVVARLEQTGDPRDRVTLKEMYAAYLATCYEMKKPASQKKAFKSSMQAALGPMVRRSNGVVNFWRGWRMRGQNPQQAS